MAGTVLIFWIPLYFVQESTRLLNCIKIGDGEVGSTELLDMEWPFLVFNLNINANLRRNPWCKWCHLVKMLFRLQNYTFMTNSIFHVLSNETNIKTINTDHHDLTWALIGTIVYLYSFKPQIVRERFELGQKWCHFCSPWIKIY